MYRNTKCFCISIWYQQLNWIHLLALIFLVEALWFSLCNITTSTNSDGFISSFLIWESLISFSYLITVARSSSTIFNKSRRNRLTCLVPDLKGKAFNFQPLKMMLASRFVINDLLYVQVCSFCAHFVEIFFIIKECWNFFISFFCFFSFKNLFFFIYLY